MYFSLSVAVVWSVRTINQPKALYMANYTSHNMMLFSYLIADTLMIANDLCSVKVAFISVWHVAFLSSKHPHAPLETPQRRTTQDWGLALEFWALAESSLEGRCCSLVKCSEANRSNQPTK